MTDSAARPDAASFEGAPKIKLRDCVWADLSHMAALWETAPRYRGFRALVKVLGYPRVRAVVWFRISQVIWRRRPLRPLALVIQNHVLAMSGAELHPGATVAPGLCLVHSAGIVFGPNIVIGKDLTVHQGVTIGNARAGEGSAVIGAGVVIGAGAKILGSLRVGDSAVIGANAVVLADVPAHYLAVGVPARSRPRPTGS